MTHLASDLVRTSTLESKHTGCSKLGTLMRGHLDQGSITYVEGMALVMYVSLRDSLALEVTQNGSGRYPFNPHAVNKLPHVLRTCIHWGPDCRRQEKDRGQTRNSGEEEISWYWK